MEFTSEDRNPSERTEGRLEAEVALWVLSSDPGLETRTIRGQRIKRYLENRFKCQKALVAMIVLLSVTTVVICVGVFVSKEPAKDICVADEHRKDCVTTGISKHDKVVGGVPATLNEFPFQVLILNSTGGAVHCGGSILNENCILTAAHCFYDDVFRYDVDEYASWRIVAGDHNRETEEGMEQTREIKDVHIHEDYKPIIGINDIAIITLNFPLELSKFIQPILLPDGDYEAKGDATVTGWGKLTENRSGGNPLILQKVRVPIVDWATCVKAYERKQVFVSIYMMCAGDMAKGGADACYGDSGGPLSVQLSNGSSMLIGVVSSGIGCARAEYPGIYMQVSKYIDWINKWITKYDDETDVATVASKTSSIPDEKTSFESSSHETYNGFPTSWPPEGNKEIKILTSTNTSTKIFVNFSEYITYRNVFKTTTTPGSYYSNAVPLNSAVSVSTCSNESCLNGGICIEKGKEISCECTARFIGERCEDIECALPGACNSAVTKPPSCKCRIGYVKDARDPAKCKSSNSDNATLLFGDDAGIQQLSISQRKTTRILSDTSLKYALDFHYPTKTMIWSGTFDKINSAPISAGASKTRVFTDHGASIRSIAVDWVHHHLYYTDVSKDKISVANLDGSMKKVLVNDGLSFPSSIVVNPSNGWMYWVDCDLKKIERAGMDGSRRQTIATTTDTPWGLAIDYTENQLYWTTYYPHPCSIHSMATDGSDQKLVLRAAAPTFSRSYFMSIAIFEDYMYWRESSTNKMYRANKCDGAELTEVISATRNDREVKVYHFSKQPAVANACARRTEQCSHLCLPIPGIGNATLSSICACPDGRTLSSDGQNCS